MNNLQNNSNVTTDINQSSNNPPSDDANPVLNSDNNGKVNSDDNITENLVTKTDEKEDLDLTWSRWKCLNCGYIYEGRGKLITCPRCGNSDPDKFDDAD